MKRLLNQIRVQSLAAILLAAGTVPFGCATAPAYPPPTADKAQLVVKVTATPKAGVQPPRTEGQYDKESVEKGRRFTRVNYSKMDCIAVLAFPSGRRVAASFSTGPEAAEVEIETTGFARDLSIARLSQLKSGDSASRAVASIKFENRRDTPITLFGSTQSDAEAFFEAKVPANGSTTCSIYVEGLYDIYCDEDERLYCQVLVTTSPFAQLCESGGEACFEGLAPGAYEVEVYAPRLPVWRMKFNATAGKRETLYAEVTVNKLPKAK